MLKDGKDVETMCKEMNRRNLNAGGARFGINFVLNRKALVT